MSSKEEFGSWLSPVPCTRTKVFFCRDEIWSKWCLQDRKSYRRGRWSTSWIRSCRCLERLSGAKSDKWTRVRFCQDKVGSLLLKREKLICGMSVGKGRLQEIKLSKFKTTLQTNATLVSNVKSAPYEVRRRLGDKLNALLYKLKQKKVR